jgi:predicted nucleotide-binding protein (sugar kinase/HSP70/actin superfamily)
LPKHLQDKLDTIGYVKERYQRTLDWCDILPDTELQERRMKEMTVVNMRWFMQTLLDRKDRMSMYQGLEVRVPFCDYRIAEYLYSVPWDYKYYGGSKFVKQGGKIAEYAAAKIEAIMLDVLKEFPQFTAPAPFSHIKELGEKVIDRGVKMGEGWLLPAETAELIEKGYNNVICTQPFGCLPNHIVGKGVIRSMREIYPNANIFPIDFDAGASKVNQENRIKLMLSVAQEEMNL